MFRAASTFYQECIVSLANDGTDWTFIPPGAPHFGGIWEAGVKSVKFYLRRFIEEHKLTFEEMITLLAQIEACLNSRPLNALSNNLTDLTALTPSHVLIQEPLMNLPEPSLKDVNVNRLSSRWALTTAMRDHFWRRWSAEYIHQLQQLRKWKKSTPNLSIGDLVLIKYELLPPAKWALARVTELHPGSDGLVRVVSLKTADFAFKRPIVKLCPLPIESSSAPADKI
ncbi:hypothetical protein RF55_9981 [Lasius niger]|uniref:DUF5641 domain-containing protein n=1 Tax=Lasius niger TaxID=67767 RepID=A0A0J7NCH8_LASNI|nr:hypothetical protein RF55_9981 [Lasius niger]